MRSGFIKAWCASLAIAVLAPLFTAHALDIPAPPPLNAPVVDQASVLTPDQVSTLEQQINASRAQKDYQFAVLIIKSLDGQVLEDYAIKVARTWGIGDKEKSNGVLLLVAMNERKIRIEVGRGLEGDLTDSEGGRIIRNTITPQFKKGDYYSGISLGVQNIVAQVEGKPEADTSAQGGADVDAGGWAEIAAFLFFFGLGGISWLAAMLARSKSWWAGGIVGGAIGIIVALVVSWVWWSIGLAVMLTLLGFLLDFVVSRNFTQRTVHGQSPNWWAGGPWIGGGRSSGGWGGGGGSFGGGGFSGGGSSGSW